MPAKWCLWKALKNKSRALLLFPPNCWESELDVWEAKRKQLESAGSPEQGNIVGPPRRQVIRAFCAICNPSLERGGLHSSPARGLPKVRRRQALLVYPLLNVTDSFLAFLCWLLWMQTQVHISYLALLALEHSKGFSVSRISYGLLKGFYSLSALSTPPGKHHTSPATSGLVRRHRWLSSSPIISEQQGVISHREAGLCIFRMRCFHSILSSMASSLALFWQVNRRSRNEGMQTHYMRRQVERDFSLSEFIPLDLQLTPKLLQ